MDFLHGHTTILNPHEKVVLFLLYKNSELHWFKKKRENDVCDVNNLEYGFRH
jgi:hypothetical protein